MAAGSLLEFAFAEIPFPLGRIQSLDLYPMSFAEYLWAVGKERAADVVTGRPGPVSDTIHEMLLEELRTYCVDVGLWQHLCGIRTDIEYGKRDLLDVYRGAMAEQFVGQEMLVCRDSDLFYWSREARGSAAETDYLAVVEGGIYGVEVKSGPAGRLRSLHGLLERYPNCRGGLVFSSRPYGELPEKRLTFLPLYFAAAATGGETAP